MRPLDVSATIERRALESVVAQSRWQQHRLLESLVGSILDALGAPRRTSDRRTVAARQDREHAIAAPTQAIPEP
jgi:hypothetical protein